MEIGVNKFIIFLIFNLTAFNSFGQVLKCSDFKNGTFTSPATEEAPLSYKIIRNVNSQIEITEDPNGILPTDFQKKQYVIIEWIDECSYRVKYDESKMKMGQFHRLVNDNGGILTEMIKIENGCFFYKSFLTVNGKTERLDGKMCIE
ncbi:hypothetical protein [Zunongwangia sp. HRR-M8]|uniref:hypothetical protein n=1 Tax=Zunongwangia sp. HRR-M8 TaxID=3015170 RepID=UPI0022DD9963|nr:hypothetical protein [Zunongwangia sp. HRR-M8]WBL23729.1 hypothetical protein PBT89_07155 [Zunongwangia sp. HRR-M8]